MTQEEIYDLKIRPLMTLIIDTCKRYRIPMVASFACPSDRDEHGEGLRCITALLGPDFLGNQDGFEEALTLLECRAPVPAMARTSSQKE